MLGHERMKKRSRYLNESGCCSILQISSKVLRHQEIWYSSSTDNSGVIRTYHNFHQKTLSSQPASQPPASASAAAARISLLEMVLENLLLYLLCFPSSSTSSSASVSSASSSYLLPSHLSVIFDVSPSSTLTLQQNKWTFCRRMMAAVGGVVCPFIREGELSEFRRGFVKDERRLSSGI